MIRIPFGPKHAEMAQKWVPSLMAFGGAASLAGLYFTDWKLVLKYVPFYGGKFPKEESKE